MVGPEKWGSVRLAGALAGSVAAVEVGPLSWSGRQGTLPVRASWGAPDVRFELPEELEPGPATDRADAGLAAVLLAAMRRGDDLHVAGEVSPRLLAASEVVQDVLTTWDRTLRPTDRWYRHIAVAASAISAPAPAERATATAAFFTGGVDSFHTAITEREHLDALVYVDGFDLDLDDHARLAAVHEHLHDAADLLGLPLLVVRTDLRRFGDAAGIGWPDHHGAGLASVAHLLAPRFGTMLVPATHTYGHLEGLGSHPLLDPLWSSDLVEIVHHGAAANRVDKLRAIAHEPAVQRHLRVCWEQPQGAGNCGRCEKCVRTAAAARAAEVADLLETLPPVGTREIARARATGRGSPWEEIRISLAESGTDPELERAVHRVLARHRRRR